MERHVPRPEQSGRRYSNADYGDDPAAGPLAMRATSSDFMQRVNAVRIRANLALRTIDNTLNGDVPIPEPHRPERGVDDAEQISHLPARRQLADVAISITSLDEERTAAQPTEEAA